MNVQYSWQGQPQPSGSEGKAKISRSSAVIAGCGAVGSAAAELLARSGVGRIRIIDRDTVKPGDPLKMSLFTEKDAEGAVPRAFAAASAIRRINPDILLEEFDEDITRDNIAALFEGFDVIVDGLNNFETRFLVNEYSVSSGIPWAASLFTASGFMSRLIVPGETPCLRCLIPDDPSPGTLSTLSALGIENSQAGAIASFLVSQAVGLILEMESAREVLSLDLESGLLRSEASGQGPEKKCPCCQGRDFAYLEGRISGRVTSLCGDNSVQIHPAVRGKVLDLPALADRLGNKNILRCNDYLLQARIDEYELTVFSNGRAIFKGVENQVEARALYSELIGN